MHKTSVRYVGVKYNYSGFTKEISIKLVLTMGSNNIGSKMKNTAVVVLL